jgi:hypothetical protein
MSSAGCSGSGLKSPTHGAKLSETVGLFNWLLTDRQSAGFSRAASEDVYTGCGALRKTAPFIFCAVIQTRAKVVMKVKGVGESEAL